MGVVWRMELIPTSAAGGLASNITLKRPLLSTSVYRCVLFSGGSNSTIIEFGGTSMMAFGDDDDVNVVVVDGWRVTPGA